MRLVDPRRLELLTSSMPWKRSSQLNYGPVKRGKYTELHPEIKGIFRSAPLPFYTTSLMMLPATCREFSTTS